MPVNLIILSEARLYREGLALTVENRSEEIDVVGACSDADSAARLVADHPGAVVLVDVSHSNVDAAIQRLTAGRSAPRLVALSLTAGTDEEVIAAAETGFSGLLAANASVDDLIDTVEHAAKGEMVCSPRAAAGLARRLADLAGRRNAPVATQSLTAREREVAELLETGLSNKQIARRLSIRLSTVKNHVHNILSKLGVERRGEAAAVLRGDLVGNG